MKANKRIRDLGRRVGKFFSRSKPATATKSIAPISGQTVPAQLTTPPRSRSTMEEEILRAFGKEK